MDQTFSFAEAHLLPRLQHATDEQLDALDFGVIGFDTAGYVRRYNSYESTAAGLRPQQVVNLPLFTSVAPCMNNFMVAQRFEDANAEQVELDVTIPYVLTLRMRPVKVQLRLLAAPGIQQRFVLVQRK